MLDLRTILFVLGLLLVFLGLAHIPSLIVDWATGQTGWLAFAESAFICLFIGAGLFLSCRGAEERNVGLREAFILTTSSWVVMPLFAALPFYLSPLHLSFTDSFFEAMSGLTTTGSTVITGLDAAPQGLLLWRAILQWLGGIGIVVMAVAILPFLQVGGMQLFRMESSEKSDKILPRATQIAGVIGLIYFGLSCACAIAYWIAGLSFFDAVAHAMTTIATGGFSTSDRSVGGFDSAAVEYIASLFMLLGSLPFLLYFQVIRGRPLELWRDRQVQAFS